MFHRAGLASWSPGTKPLREAGDGPVLTCPRILTESDSGSFPTEFCEHLSPLFVLPSNGAEQHVGSFLMFANLARG